MPFTLSCRRCFAVLQIQADLAGAPPWNLCAWLAVFPIHLGWRPQLAPLPGSSALRTSFRAADAVD